MLHYTIKQIGSEQFASFSKRRGSALHQLWLAISRNSTSGGQSLIRTNPLPPQTPFPISFPIQIPAVCLARSAYLTDSPAVALCVWRGRSTHRITLHFLLPLTKGERHKTHSTDPVTQFSLINPKPSFWFGSHFFVWNTAFRLQTAGVFMCTQTHKTTSARRPVWAES